MSDWTFFFILLLAHKLGIQVKQLRRHSTYIANYWMKLVESLYVGYTRLSVIALCTSYGCCHGLPPDFTVSKTESPVFSLIVTVFGIALFQLICTYIFNLSTANLENVYYQWENWQKFKNYAVCILIIDHGNHETYTVLLHLVESTDFVLNFKISYFS